MGIKHLTVKALYLCESMYVEVGCQHDSLLLSVPVEFAASKQELRVSWTLICSDIGHHGVLLSERCAVYHRHYGHTQTFVYNFCREKAEESHDIEDQSTAWDIEPRNRNRLIVQ